MGFGVYYPRKNLRTGGGLPGEIYLFCRTICHRTCTGLIDFNSINKAVIFSDSKSALEDIGKIGLNSKSNYMTLQVKNKLISLIKRQNREVHLCWISSHSGIKHTDVADQIANVARLEPPIDIKLRIREFFPKLKHNIWNAWSMKWKEIGRVKGVNFSSHFEQPLSRPWFHKLKLSRREIITLNRLRSKPDRNCECGELGDITHILLECSLHRRNSQILYEAFINEKFSSPLHVNSILFNHSQLELSARLISCFLDACGLKL